MLLDTIPGVGELLALTSRSVGEISRFARPEELVSYGRLAPRVHQSSQARPRSGPLSKSGSRLLGSAAVDAAQQAWRESNPWHDLYVDVARRPPDGASWNREAGAAPIETVCGQRRERDEHPSVSTERS
ncbi:MAG TPA: IS110 family transposase [Gaiellaceae bacterium]|nr:IS110 family transposase [Gaiellaceae bacterium]